MDFHEIRKELTDSESLILTCYGEARGEHPDGQIAVMQVIVNRARVQHKTIKDVCFAPLQFSCWNENDPNFAILAEMAHKLVLPDTPDFDAAYEQIAFLAGGVLDKQIQNLVGPAQNYMTTALYQSPTRPKWANNAKVAKVIGSHTFLVL